MLTLGATWLRPPRLARTGGGNARWVEPMMGVVHALPAWRVVLPTAPMQPVTLNNGFVMNSW